MERKSRRCWKYLFCFAESDFTPRQGHQHSAFVTTELQQAVLVCRGAVREAVGALLGTANGGLRGRLKSFHPLLTLPCGHVHKTKTEKKRVGWCIHGWRRGKVRETGTDQWMFECCCYFILFASCLRLAGCFSSSARRYRKFKYRTSCD